MSEINIQRKSGSSALWWALGIIALLILAWLLFANMGTDAQTGHVVDPAGPAAVVSIIGTLIV